MNTNRKAYLERFTIRQLRIYGRQQGVRVLQKWAKPELINAILLAGK